MNKPDNIHATGIILDGQGVLITGRSGAGKSLLALALLDKATSQGKTAVLVSDDQVLVFVDDQSLFMKGPKTITGQIELRGRGIISRPFVASGQVDLVVDLVEKLHRMADPEHLTTRIANISVARCPVPENGVIDIFHQLLLVAEALSALMQPGD